LPFKEPPEPLNVALAMELSAEAELGQLEALVTTHEAQFIKMGDALGKILESSTIHVAISPSHLFSRWE